MTWRVFWQKLIGKSLLVKAYWYVGISASHLNEIELIFWYYYKISHVVIFLMICFNLDNYIDWYFSSSNFTNWRDRNWNIWKYYKEGSVGVDYRLSTRVREPCRLLWGNGEFEFATMPFSCTLGDMTFLKSQMTSRVQEVEGFWPCCEMYDFPLSISF